MTPEIFLTKNMKWITLILFILFLFKSVQSCNRNTIKSMSDKQYEYIIDSLTTKYNVLEKETTAMMSQLQSDLSREKGIVTGSKNKIDFDINSLEKENNFLKKENNMLQKLNNILEEKVKDLEKKVKALEEKVKAIDTIKLK